MVVAIFKYQVGNENIKCITSHSKGQKTVAFAPSSLILTNILFAS